MSGEAWHDFVGTEQSQRQGWQLCWPREYGAYRQRSQIWISD